MKYNYIADLSEVKELAEKDSAWIEIHRLGKWFHPKWKWMEGTVEMFNSFIKNFENNVIGRKIIFDQSHISTGSSAVGTGFVEKMKMRGDKLVAFVKFTNVGLDLIRNKGHIYFSPEYTDDYIDKELKKHHGPTLIGGALTMRPFLTNLNPIMLSENLENSCYGNTMFSDKTTNKEMMEKMIVELIAEYSKEMGISSEDIFKKLRKGLFSE